MQRYIKIEGNFFNKNMKAKNQVELVLVERRILEWIKGGLHTDNRTYQVKENGAKSNGNKKPQRNLWSSLSCYCKEVKIKSYINRM